MPEKILISKDISNLKQFSVDGHIPEIVMFPKTAEQICQIMMLAKKENKKVIIQGYGNQKYFGGKVQPFDIVISTSRLNNIIDYDYNNFTITVASGIRLCDLQTELKKHNQFLPLDPFGREKSTIGGIVATNASGPRRFLYGTCRDLILGMRYVLPDGTYAKSGGKTMKNVAGYDLTKFFIGSMGTLGVIVHVTFKLYPLPKYNKTIEINFTELGSCNKFIDKMLASKLVFSSIDLLNNEAMKKIKRTTTNSKTFSLLIRFEGDRKAIDYSVEQLTKHVKSSNASGIDLLNEEHWQQFPQSELFFSTSKNKVSIKVCLPLAKIAEGIELIDSYDNISVTIICHAGNGIIYASFAMEIKSPEIGMMINELRLKIKDLGGNLTVQAIPFQFKNEVIIWETSEPELVMMRKIKSQFDPYQIIAKGRFIGGI